jgi:hypothetical protein
MPTPQASQRAPAAASAAQQVFDLLSLPSELLLAIAAQLHPNEVALLLRPLCRRMRQLLGTYKTVQLSGPVTPPAFIEHWRRAEAVKGLTLGERRELVRLTAKSGVAANLRLLAAGPRGPEDVGAAGCTLMQDAFVTAAEAGQLEACKLLHELGCPWGPAVAKVRPAQPSPGTRRG